MAHDKIAPALVAGTPADFTQLSPEGFESFCEALVRVQDGVDCADKHGTRGQADKAVDVLARRKDGKFDLYQCKNYASYSVANLDDHIAEFQKHLPDWQAQGPIIQYFLLVACQLDDTKLQAAITRHTIALREQGIGLHVWSGGTIETRLAPHVQIVERFFDAWWVPKLCNPSAVAQYDLLKSREQSALAFYNHVAENQKNLQALLAGLPIHIEKIRSIFRQITHCETSAADTIASMLHDLEDYELANPELSNTDLLVIRLAALCQQLAKQDEKAGNTSQQHHTAWQKLEAWLDAVPRTYAAPIVAAEQERLAEQQTRNQSAQWIVLHPYREDEARAWSYGENEWGSIPLPLPKSDDFAEWLAPALGMVASEFGVGNGTIIELVLPWEKLFARSVGVEFKPDTDFSYRIGESGLMLVLRLQERWQNPAWHGNWRKRWQAMQTKLVTLPEVCFHPGNKPQCNDRWHWLALTNPEANKPEFKKALYEGAPFALWCAPEDMDFIQKKFTECNYLDFHQHFQRFGNLREGASHIHCLIDDPEHIPPGGSEIEDRYRQPQKRN